jgi:hypothetical protein
VDERSALPSALMRIAAAAIAVSVALFAGCDQRFVGVEPWEGSAGLRVVTSFSPLTKEARVLSGGEAYEVALGDLFERGESLDVWLFAYSSEQRVEQYPGLAGKSEAELAAILSPTFGSEGAFEPSPAREVLHAEVTSAGTKEITYERKGWSDWLEEVEAKRVVPFSFVIPRSEICSAITVRRIDAPPDLEIAGLAAASDELAFFSAAKTGTTALIIGGIEGDAAQELRRVDLGSPPRGKIERNPIDGSVWGVTERGRVFRFAENGELRDVPEQDFRASQVSVGLDGTVIAVGSSMNRLEDRRWAPFFDHLPAPIGFLEVVRADRMAAWLNLWVYFFGGSDWDAELYVPQFDQLLIDVSGDDEVMVAVGYDGYVRVRDEQTWTTPPFDLGRNDLHTAAALRRGRFIAAGRSGAAGVWNGRAWCPLSTGFSGLFHASAGSPSGRSALLAGAVEEGGSGPRSVIFRVEIPERL